MRILAAEAVSFAYGWTAVHSCLYTGKIYGRRVGRILSGWERRVFGRQMVEKSQGFCVWADSLWLPFRWVLVWQSRNRAVIWVRRDSDKKDG